MPTHEIRVSFGDPRAVRFEDTLVIPRLLYIDDSTKVRRDNFGNVIYTDRADGTWQQIAIVPPDDKEKIREQIAARIMQGIISGKGQKAFGLEDCRFAIGPVFELIRGVPVLLRSDNLVGIWHKENEERWGLDVMRFGRKTGHK